MWSGNKFVLGSKENVLKILQDTEGRSFHSMSSLEFLDM